MKMSIPMPRWTALVIHNEENDIRCEAAENGESHMWMGLIAQYKNNNLHTLLISTGDIFPDQESAVAEMESILSQLRAKSLAELLAPPPKETPTDSPSLT